MARYSEFRYGTPQVSAMLIPPRLRGMQDVISFETEHQLGVYSATICFPTTRVRHLFDQPLTAPFDDYNVNAFVFVIDKATNESVLIPRFELQPLIRSTTSSRFPTIRRSRTSSPPTQGMERLP